MDGDGDGGRTDGRTFQSRFLLIPSPDAASLSLSYYARAEKEGGNFEVCDCRRRRRRLVMNLTSRLEFISVTRRGALALEGGPGLLLFSPSVPKTGPPISWLLGSPPPRRRSRPQDARSNTCGRTRPYRRHGRGRRYADVS